jgi:hypothetical protein
MDNVAEIVECLARQPELARLLLAIIEAHFGLTPGSIASPTENVVEVNTPADRLLFELAEELHHRLKLLDGG